MAHKTKLTILAILSCCALFSMGFASWTITQAPQYVTGTITADDVIYSDAYLRMEEGFPSGFIYTLKGFMEDNELAGYKGTMTVQYTLDLDKCRSLYDTDEMIVEVTLGYDGEPSSNLFADGNDFVSAKVNNEESNGGINEGKYLITLPVDLTSEKSTMSIDIVFTFDFGTDENAYLTYVYNAFYGTDLRFEFNAKLKMGDD